MTHLSQKKTPRVSHLIYFTYNIYHQRKKQNEVHGSDSAHTGGN